MVGLEQLSNKSNNSSCPFLDKDSPSWILKPANSFISAPATNALSPVPVIIIYFTSLLRSE